MLKIRKQRMNEMNLDKKNKIPKVKMLLIAVGLVKSFGFAIVSILHSIMFSFEMLVFMPTAFRCLWIVCLNII